MNVLSMLVMTLMKGSYGTVVLMAVAVQQLQR